VSQEFGQNPEEMAYFCYIVFVAFSGKNRQLGKPSGGVFIYIYSIYTGCWLGSLLGLLTRAPTCCLLSVVWASSQYGSFRKSWISYKVTQRFKHKYSGRQEGNCIYALVTHPWKSPSITFSLNVLTRLKITQVLGEGAKFPLYNKRSVMIFS
jgi:hypothetical protein